MQHQLVSMLTGLVLAFSFSAQANDGEVLILRSLKDRAREREWLLTPHGVTVIDRKATPVAVRLPEWIWAGEAYACPPDLALGPKGEALVTSNVVPVLWRVDPVTLAVTRHALLVDAHAAKDLGFTGLTYAPALGVYFAVSEFGALWRIDPLLRRAEEIPLEPPLRRACRVGAGPRRLQLRIHADGASWEIRLTPDQRSAYARPR